MNKAYCLHVTFCVMPAAAAVAAILLFEPFSGEKREYVVTHNACIMVQRVYELVKVCVCA